ATIAPGASDTFTVQLDTATIGAKTGDITFTNNDPDESPFNFTITGTVIAGPEVTVLFGATVIADGDTTPSTADGTDFGTGGAGSSPVSRTFTVRNDGASTLTLSNLTVPTGFSISEGLSASLAPGASDTFTVLLATSSIGTKSGNITFDNN